MQRAKAFLWHCSRRLLCRVFREALSASLLFGFAPPEAAATTWNVPSEKPTIQEGLNAAVTGDTVLVAPGQYSAEIIFWPDRNGITLLGAGAASTIVEGNGSLAVFY